MTTEPLAGCTLRLSADDLSAWRDGALDDAAKARLDTHISECAACRTRIGEYDDIARALRAIPTPEPLHALGSNPRTRGATTSERPTPAHPAIRHRRAFSSLGAFAAVVLLALGFAQVLHFLTPPGVRTSTTATSQPQGTSTPIPTAIPAAPAADGPHLIWQQAQLPVKPLTDRDTLNFGVVPGHGESAYACYAVLDSTGATLTFYRTTDRALHWTILTQFKEPHVDVSECVVQVDALDTNLVLVQVRGENIQAFKNLEWYELSEDGGATWTRLDNMREYNDPINLYGLTTLNGRTYALRHVPTIQGSFIQNLSVSVDHLHTWQPIDPTFVTPNHGVTNFWLNPDGELLAEVTTVTYVSTPRTTPSPIVPVPSTRPISHLALWRSIDGGAHWTAFPAPTLSTLDWSTSRFLVGQPAAGQPWQICAPYQNPDDNSSASLVCTFDGGLTWSARPLLCSVARCDGPMSLSGSQYALSGGPYALASNGDVLRMDVALRTTINQLGLYRLPRGSTTWQYLGPTAGGNAYFFAPTSNGAILWLYPGGVSPGRLSGIMGRQPALPDALSTATYP